MKTPGKILYTFGNLLMLIGMYVLLYVGGLFADEQYNVYAASGDNDVSVSAIADTDDNGATTREVADSVASAQVAGSPTPSPTAPPAPTPSRRRFKIPDLSNGSEGKLTNAVPAMTGNYGLSTVTRIVVPAIKIDKKVVEVGWTVERQADGQDIAIWDVDKYRVGHHKGSSNPGGGGNIVLAGHSGGRAYPFNDIYYLKPGDLVQLSSNGQIYDYAVSENILLDEVGQPLAKRLENARYIGPTSEEVITMVACWPLSGPDKFKQRIVIRAKPVDLALESDPVVPEQISGTKR